MAQMNTAQARVVDPVLTEVARGYRNAEHVGLNLFPYVPVGQRGGKVVEFGKEAFKLYRTARAPGGNVGSVDFAYSNTPYALEQHALNGKVPVELLEDAKAIPGIDLGKIAVSQVMDIIHLRLEYQQAQLARNAASYAASNKVTLSGTSQWSDASSKPSSDIETAREAIRTKTGLYPNVAIISAAVFSVLKTHPQIIDRIKYTGRDSVTAQMLAALWDIDQVHVGKAVYADESGAFTDVWGKDVVLAYAAPASLAAMGSPSYAYTYRLRNYPVAEEANYSKNDRSWYYPVIDEVSPVIAGADAGYLITNAVA
ncbi:hypothetical protein COW20_15245 [bacterium (Candidatus Blackallbacteria) CG13_big_fil_rev_8_21_14_2_50_49_14]|nr:MAG: hypothetical protein COW64_15085 [bacterium (Candidatus Blackallbacteria) CG18_big_fil_WC_8_21_14_2_50_49_26]PIW46642.1 MAG: hypothetical protein COW20_15245 [bacterium (Candidatus Blackallbacteria) CG13_big_fil_rev_8_21_14_2_50_49_14]